MQIKKTVDVIKQPCLDEYFDIDKFGDDAEFNAKFWSWWQHQPSCWPCQSRCSGSEESLSLERACDSSGGPVPSLQLLHSRFFVSDFWLFHHFYIIYKLYHISFDCII